MEYLEQNDIDYHHASAYKKTAQKNFNLIQHVHMLNYARWFLYMYKNYKEAKTESILGKLLNAHKYLHTIVQILFIPQCLSFSHRTDHGRRAAQVACTNFVWALINLSYNFWQISVYLFKLGYKYNTCI